LILVCDPSDEMMKYRITIISGLALIIIATCWLAARSAVFAQGQGKEQDPQRSDVIKLDTALVSVPVIVTDRYGRLVPGLTTKDFLLRENGESQEIVSFSSTEAPFNVALLIDTSRSTRNILSTIRKAALNFIKQLKPQDRVQIVTFDERVHFLGEFTNDRDALSRTIKSVKTSYLTSIYDAVQMTIKEKLAPIRGRKAIVILTDGVDTYSRQATAGGTLEMVANLGIPSYSIQYETRNSGGAPMRPPSLPGGSFNFFRSSFIGSSFVSSGQGPRQVQPDRYIIATSCLQSLATQSGARYLRAESIENTAYAFALIAEELRNQYTLAYYSTNEKRDGSYRKIEIRLNRADLSTRSRPGYRVTKVEEAESGEPGKKSPEVKKP
jgi:Ca-activated chloride channel family protein